METKEYVENALNTEPQDYSPVAYRISEPKTLVLLLLAIEKVIRSANELDEFKRHLFYGKDLKDDDPVLVPETTNEHYQKAIGRYKDHNFLRLLHSGMGLATEAGEFMEALADYIIGEGNLDKVNLAEELGDTCWYVAVGSDATEVPLSSILQTNIDKLRARFPNRFTEQSALNRDLDKEREILENTDK